MAGHPKKFFSLSCLVLLLVLLEITSVPANCPRSARCSRFSTLRRHWRRTIDFLVPSSQFLAVLTSRTLTYTNVQYKIRDPCHSACATLSREVKVGLNLPASSCTNVSTSTVLEFHRRISQGHNHLLRESLADLSRFKSLTTPPTDLTFLQDYVQNTINKLVTKAVKIDRRLKGFPPLNTTADQQQLSSTMRKNSHHSQSAHDVMHHLVQCVLADLLEASTQMIIDFLKIKRGGSASNFLVWCNVAMKKCLPAQLQPCQRNRDINASLSDALVMSRLLMEQISIIHQNMSRRWPIDPYQETNVDFYVPLPRSNKTTIRPEEVLEDNINTLTTFISLMGNSTSQLKRFPAADGSVTNGLEDLKRDTRTLISFLRRSVALIRHDQRHNSTSKPSSQSVQTKPGLNTTQGTGSITIQYVTLQTQIILDDFRSNLLILISDILRIKGLSCN